MRTNSSLSMMTTQHRGRLAAVLLLWCAGCASSIATNPLPADIVRALQTDQRVLDCTEGTRDGRSQFQADWVTVQRRDLNDDGTADWIVSGVHRCLRQQDTTDYWLYLEAGDHRRLLGTQRAIRSLQVLPGHTSGYRDLQVETRDGPSLVRYNADRYPQATAPSSP